MPVQRMKLAEALVLRKTLTAKCESLRTRVHNNSVGLKGVKPQENLESLLDEMSNAHIDLTIVMATINHVNTATVVDGQTLTYWLAHRDVVKTLAKSTHDTMVYVSNTMRRYVPAEGVIEPEAYQPVSHWRAASDASAKELREVDARIQSTNWTTEIEIELT